MCPLVLLAAAALHPYLHVFFDGPRPFVVEQRFFRLPYDYDVGDPPGQPVRVRLYDSTDFGMTWKFVREHDGSRGTFPFEADADGVYCFQLQGVLKDGRKDPADAGRLRPALIVIVDTRPPQAEPSRGPEPKGPRKKHGPAPSVPGPLYLPEQRPPPAGSVGLWRRAGHRTGSVRFPDGRFLPPDGFRFDGGTVSLYLVSAPETFLDSPDGYYRVPARWIGDDLYWMNPIGPPRWWRLATFTGGGFRRDGGGGGDRLFEKVDPDQVGPEYEGLLKERSPYRAEFLGCTSGRH